MAIGPLATLCGFDPGQCRRIVFVGRYVLNQGRRQIQATVDGSQNTADKHHQKNKVSRSPQRLPFRSQSFFRTTFCPRQHR